MRASQIAESTALSYGCPTTTRRQHLTAGQEYTVQQLINHAINVNDFHVALLNVAGRGNVVSNDRLGRWLKRNEGRLVNGSMLVRMGIKDGYQLWSLGSI